MKSPRHVDLITSVEACYRVEQPDSDWLRGVIESLSWLDQGLGIFGFTYTLSTGLELRPDAFVEVGCPASVSDALEIIFESGPDFNQVYLDIDFGAASAQPGFLGGPADVAARERGVLDSWAINGRNWDRQNVAVILNCANVIAPSQQTAALLKRLAIHLAAGARLQRRFHTAERPTSVDAVLSPGGRVEHAEGSARNHEVLRALANATVAMERARGTLRKSQPEQAVDAWKARVAARWTLVERFERDGKRFVVACENQPEVFSEQLSGREQQVLASAALGRSNKEIAYDLGLADSTVRVLFARAAKKLGARNRREAVQQFRSPASSAS